MSARYDEIGKGYDTTRRADPHISHTLFQLLNLSDSHHSVDHPVLDIACGTGNYTIALAQLGLKMDGVDISDEMLEHARKKSDQVNWVQGDVHQLPFEDSQYEGATCILSIHHFADLIKVFREAYRVISMGKLVIFTSCPEQMQRYWLGEYFPKLMQASWEQMPNQSVVVDALQQAGFHSITTEPYFVQEELQDFFLYSGKYRPDMYLVEEVRRGISSFANLAEQEEVRSGCAQLAADIADGRIQHVIQSYTHDQGDYLYVVANK